MQLLISRIPRLITSGSNATSAIRAGSNRVFRHPLVARVAYPLFLVCFAGIVFWKIILTREYTILSYPDSSGQSYPWFQYIAETLHRGNFPLWDPFTFGGRSFIGEVQTGAFYPLNILMGLLPLNARGLLPMTIIEGFVVLHCFLASLFTYLLARYLGLPRFSSLVSGVAFAYSGSIGVRAFGQINILYAATWLPVVFLCYFKSLDAITWKRRLFFANLSGLTLALCLLGGHHQPFIYCSIAIACTALLMVVSSQSRGSFPPPSIRRSVLVVTPLLFLFALSYSSIQLLPSVEYASHAYRWIGGQAPVLANQRIPYSIGGTLDKLPPEGVLDLVFPFIVSVDNTPYFGVLPALFVLFSVSEIRKSKVVQICWCLALLFLTLALADIAPLHGIFYFMVPGFGRTRSADRSLMVFHLAVSLLAGVGCTLFLRSTSKKERNLRLRSIQIFGAFSLISTFLVVIAYFYRSQVLYLATNSNYNSLFFACILLLLAAALARARFFGVLRIRFVKVFLIILCLLDYHYFLSVHIRTKEAFDRKTNYEPAQYFREDGVLKFLRSQPGTFRVDFRGEYYPKNIGEVYRLETMEGHGATAPKEFFDLAVAGHFGVGRLSDLYNVKYIVSNEDLSLPRVFGEDRTKVYENPTCLARAWLVGTVIPKKNSEELLPALLDPLFDPRNAALVYGRPGSSLPSANPEGGPGSTGPSSGDVHFEAHGPNRFTVIAETPEAAFLVVSGNWDPSWKATTNGVPSSIQLTDGALMGVNVGPGRSTIDFRYRPKGMYWSLALAGVAGIALLYTGLRKGRAPEPASSLLVDRGLSD